MGAGSNHTGEEKKGRDGTITKVVVEEKGWAKKQNEEAKRREEPEKQKKEESEKQKKEESEKQTKAEEEAKRKEEAAKQSDTQKSEETRLKTEDEEDEAAWREQALKRAKAGAESDFLSRAVQGAADAGAPGADGRRAEGGAWGNEGGTRRLLQVPKNWMTDFALPAFSSGETLAVFFGLISLQIS